MLLRSILDRTGDELAQPRRRRRRRAVVIEDKLQQGDTPELPEGTPDATAHMINSGQHGREYFADCVRVHDNRPERQRDGRQYLHASMLTQPGICAPNLCLDMIAGDATHERVGSCMRLVWAYGRAAEKHVRDAFIATVGAVNVVGRWKCRCGALKRDGIGGDFDKCGKCGKRADIYDELPILNHDFRLTGSPDILYLRPDDGRMRIV